MFKATSLWGRVYETNTKYKWNRNFIKNPNWWEAGQLAIYKAWRSWIRDHRRQIHQWQGAGFEPVTSGLQVQRPTTTTRLPPCSGKTESFCTSHSNICNSPALRQFSDEFHTMIGRNRAKQYDHLPQHRCCAHGNLHGNASHIWSTCVIQTKTAGHNA